MTTVDPERHSPTVFQRCRMQQQMIAWVRPVRNRGKVDYYDALLITVAAALVIGASLSMHSAVAAYQGLGTGSVIATVFMYEILFRNPPMYATGSPTMASGVVGLGWLVTVLHRARHPSLPSVPFQSRALDHILRDRRGAFGTTAETFH